MMCQFNLLISKPYTVYILIYWHLISFIDKYIKTFYYYVKKYKCKSYISYIFKYFVKLNICRF